MSVYIKTLSGETLRLDSVQNIYSAAASALGIDSQDLVLIRDEEVLPDTPCLLTDGEVLHAFVDESPYKVSLQHRVNLISNEAASLLMIFKLFNRDEVVHEKWFPLTIYMKDGEFGNDIIGSKFPQLLSYLQQKVMPEVCEDLPLSERDIDRIAAGIEHELHRLKEPLWERMCRV